MLEHWASVCLWEVMTNCLCIIWCHWGRESGCFLLFSSLLKLFLSQPPSLLTFVFLFYPVLLVEENELALCWVWVMFAVHHTALNIKQKSYLGSRTMHIELHRKYFFWIFFPHFLYSSYFSLEQCSLYYFWFGEICLVHVTRDTITSSQLH